MPAKKKKGKQRERRRKEKSGVSKGAWDTTICNTEECTRPQVNLVSIIVFGQFHGGDDGL
jgi:hypothetical protein